MTSVIDRFPWKVRGRVRRGYWKIHLRYMELQKFFPEDYPMQDEYHHVPGCNGVQVFSSDEIVLLPTLCSCPTNAWQPKKEE